MSDFRSGPEAPVAPFAYLVIERGPTPDKQYHLTAVANTLGRSPNNEVVINDLEISRRHAQIAWRGNGATIEDLGSTNGTFVNGQRANSVTALQHGDKIELGDTVSLYFYLIGSPLSVPVTAPTSLENEDTADLPPIRLAPTPPPPPPQNPIQQPAVASQPADNGRSRTLIGCIALVVLLICFCGALTVALDSYNQGQYLYCGGLRPFWEIVLGPLGFNPICP